MKKIILFLILILLSNSSFSQTVPTISTKDDVHNLIFLSHLNISVFVVENMATTTLEMEFYNNSDRTLEGELNFPLNNGVTVSRFALDVNGEMREGVVVDKEKATQAFEAVTRQNIDPGLVEQTKGNNFKARVYPILSKKYKKAILAFDQELVGDDKNYLYQLPLNLKNKLKEFGVRVEVVNNEPVVKSSTNELVNLNFSKSRESYISEYQSSNILLDEHITFSIPKPKKLNKVITYKGSVTSDNYFYINLNCKPEFKPKNKPQEITLVWDASSSAQNRDIDKEIEIVKEYIQWMKKGTVKLITFSNTVHTTKSYQLQDGINTALLSFLKNIKYDGGTNLYAIDYSKLTGNEILLFSDGLSNFGTSKKLTNKQPLLTINSAYSANHNLLEHLATNSNGIYINTINKPINRIVHLMTTNQKQFIRADFETQKISEVYPKAGKKIIDQFNISGIMEGATAPIILHFGFGDKITESHKIIIDNTQRKANKLGERIWAQKKLNQLLISGNSKFIRDHGKKFNLVTPNTSLVVLDAVADYVRYDITPPPSLLKEYNKLISEQQSKNRDNKQKRITQLCQNYSDDIHWWENAENYKNKKINKESVSLILEEIREPVEIMEIVDEEMEVSETPIESLRSNSDQELTVSFSKSLNKSKKRNKPTIKIKKWESNASYINELKSVEINAIYQKYLTLKPQYADNPSFYFDVATFLFQKNQRKNGLRVISNLAELELENTELLRTLGRKLYEFEFYDASLFVFEEVLEKRPFEPHSYIDIGLTYNEMDKHQKAIEFLYQVIDNEWDADIMSRFNGIELITLHDINHIIAQHKNKLDTSFINSCFIKNLPVDIRIVIDWDANDTDIDLWIKDPTKEICMYSNKNSKIGGKISNDITRGYGPEEFRLKHAINGKYQITANFFGTRKQTELGKVTVRAFVYTYFGSKNMTKEVLTLQLDSNKKNKYVIGEIEFKK